VVDGHLGFQPCRHLLLVGFHFVLRGFHFSLPFFSVGVHFFRMTSWLALISASRHAIHHLFCLLFHLRGMTL
jgi:hypothetical protein